MHTWYYIYSSSTVGLGTVDASVGLGTQSLTRERSVEKRQELGSRLEGEPITREVVRWA